MTPEILTPRKSEDGIVFYVSADGKTTGISIRGIARLATGREAGDMFNENRNRILFLMASGVDHDDIPKSLKSAWGNVFVVDHKGSDGAKIVTEKAAVAIIKYFAIEKLNPVALETLDKFLEKGFGTWVKEIVNFASNPASTETILLETIQQVLTEVKALTVKVEKWDKIEGISATVYPGLKMLNDSLSTVDKQKILDSGEMYTAVDWLGIKGIVLDKSTKHSFVRQASDTYLTMTGKRPKKKYKPVDRQGGVKWVLEGNGYRIVDFHILEAALNSLKESKTA